MTPPARLQAAIEVLDIWLTGIAAEKALTNWARGARYAGSKDRAAVRDIVFDCLRKRGSYTQVLPDTGRGLVIGHAMTWDTPIEELFSDGGYGPASLTPEELRDLEPTLGRLTRGMMCDCPDWIATELDRSLGDDLFKVTDLLRTRASVFLRVNTLKATAAQAQTVLSSDGIETVAHPLASTALEVTANPRKVQQSQAYQTGLVELQDAASQAVCETLPVEGAPRILDYCAGGGGKTLAIAARSSAPVFAHDANPRRMNDIASRAKRAGAKVQQIAGEKLANSALFDLVLCDVPCSGSGAWRRSPEGKWRLTPDMLEGLLATQARILDQAASLVAPGGMLAYATCSLLRQENADQVAGFVGRNPAWALKYDRQFTPLDGGDGFYVAHLTR